jgi:hypothetical protein
VHKASLKGKYRDDNYLFYRAQKIIIGLVQKITFEEWLPLVIGSAHPIPPYVYTPAAPSTTLVEFALTVPYVWMSAAADRVLFSDQNQELTEIPLGAGFFNPNALHTVLGAGNGVCTVLTGMLRDTLSLVGPQLPFGLWGINMPAFACEYQRAGFVPTFNETVAALLALPGNWLAADLRPISTLADITKNPTKMAFARALYPPGFTNAQVAGALDLYTGLLIEDHGPESDAIIGPVTRALLALQLANYTRNGDAGWYAAPFYAVSRISKQSKVNRILRGIESTTLAYVLSENCEFIESLETDQEFTMWAVSDIKIIEETSANLNNANLGSLVFMDVLIFLMAVVLLALLVVAFRAGGRGPRPPPPL